MNTLERMMAFEDGEISVTDTLELFAELIRTGRAWSLQGSYGRAARAMIDAGHLSPSGQVTDEGRTIADEYDGTW